VGSVRVKVFGLWGEIAIVDVGEVSCSRGFRGRTRTATNTEEVTGEEEEEEEEEGGEEGLECGCL